MGARLAAKERRRMTIELIKPGAHRAAPAPKPLISRDCGPAGCEVDWLASRRHEADLDIESFTDFAHGDGLGRRTAAGAADRRQGARLSGEERPLSGRSDRAPAADAVGMHGREDRDQRGDGRRAAGIARAADRGGRRRSPIRISSSTASTPPPPRSIPPSSSTDRSATSWTSPTAMAVWAAWRPGPPRSGGRSG